MKTNNRYTIRDRLSIWILLFGVIFKGIKYHFKRKKLGNNFEYVYVMSNGSVRELNIEERAYLNTDFHGADSGRPYIKDNYKYKNGWGDISGFCYRYDIPKRINILPYDNKYKEIENNEIISKLTKFGYKPTIKDGKVINIEKISGA